MKKLNFAGIQLKPAKPDQATEAAPLIYDTDPPLWDYIFSHNQKAALDFFTHQWLDKRSPFSYSLCTTAMNGQHLLGIQLGRDHTRIKLRADNDVLSRFKYTNYLIPPILKGVYYITFLSVSPDARNMGLGGDLLRSTFEKARKAGYTSCQLDTYSDNRAVSFYQRHGMEILSVSRVLPLEKYGVPSSYRMEILL